MQNSDIIVIVFNEFKIMTQVDSKAKESMRVKMRKVQAEIKNMIFFKIQQKIWIAD